MAAGADAIAVFTGASEAFTAANINMSIEESRWTSSSRCSSRPRSSTCGGEATSRPPSAVHTRARSTSATSSASRRSLFALGCEEISIGDTIGVANPDDVRRVVEAVATEVPLDRIALHLHDTQGMALANAEAGLELGVSVFDAAVGGTRRLPVRSRCARQPGHRGAGQACLEREGIEHGVDADRLDHIAASLREVLAR